MMQQTSEFLEEDPEENRPIILGDSAHQALSTSGSGPIQVWKLGHLSAQKTGPVHLVVDPKLHLETLGQFLGWAERFSTGVVGQVLGDLAMACHGKFAEHQQVLFFFFF